MSRGTVANVIERFVRPGMTAFDIGANRGHMTRAMANAGATVIAFEPITSHAAEIERSGIPGVRVVPCAVSDAPGFADFYLDERPQLDGQGSSLRQIADGKAVQVPVITLDGFTATEGVAPDFIKIDVEGVEEKVIAGGLATILRHKPVIVFEVWGHNWPRFEKVIADLSNCYRFECVSDGSNALERYASQITENDDVICIPKHL